MKEQQTSFADLATIEAEGIRLQKNEYSLQETGILTGLSSFQIRNILPSTGTLLTLTKQDVATVLESEKAKQIRQIEQKLSEKFNEPVWATSRVTAALEGKTRLFLEAIAANDIKQISEENSFSTFLKESDVKTVFEYSKDKSTTTKIVDFTRYQQSPKIEIPQVSTDGITVQQKETDKQKFQKRASVERAITAKPLIYLIGDDLHIYRLLKKDFEILGLDLIGDAEPLLAKHTLEEQNPHLLIVADTNPNLEDIAKSDTPFIIVCEQLGPVNLDLYQKFQPDLVVEKEFVLNTEVFGAYVDAILRRYKDKKIAEVPVVKVADIEIDLNRRLVSKNNNILVLTKTEYELIFELARNPDRVLTSNHLLTKVWGPEYINDLQYLRVWISRLRDRLGDSEFTIIKTFQGIGYALMTDPD